MRATRLFTWTLCGVIGWAGAASAVDGITEINQAGALAGNVTPGDIPGFPVTIDAPGSYRLTSNLDLRALPGAENTTAIQILTGDVQIDLNGFAILGPTICSGSPPSQALSCAPIGSGYGIIAGSQPGIRVSNGTISGSGNSGVYCGRGCQVTDMRVENTGSSGIVAANGSVIRGNTARRNRFSGIGFTTNGGLVIEGNAVEENGDAGIFGGSGDVIERNVSKNNGAQGIRLNGEGVAKGNTSSGNGDTGILAVNRCLVVDNVVTANGGYGLALGADSAYERNVIGGNAPGAVVGGVQIGTNLCNGSTTCP